MIRTSSRSRRHLPASLGDERGAVLILVVFALLGLIAIAALAIDLGVMYTARNESQNVADGAAHAGASMLILNPTNEAAAREEAMRFAAKNHVRGQPVVLEDEDIEVMLDEEKVRVWVRNCAGTCEDSDVTVERNNPIRTFFANVVGIETVDVVTMAAAKAFPAGGAECLVPIVLPDRWQENGEFDCKNNSGDCPERYDSEAVEPNSDDLYVPWKDAETGIVNPNFTGYAEEDFGLQIQIRQPHGGPGEINPSWYLHWVFPEDKGGNAFREAWYSCDPDLTVAIGDAVVTEPGGTVGPLRDGVDSVLAMDDTQWDAQQGCPVDHLGGPCRMDSRRIRPLPMFNPESERDLGNGRKEFRISNFANIYIAGRVNTEITGYFMGYGGVANPEDAGETTSPLFKWVRLVE